MPAAGLTKSPRTPRRRTQAERTATTCARLLDATIDCLLDVGYARTTTTDIARRAGVSRGAQLHHFPTKAELVTAAVEHLSMRRHAEFVRAIGKLPAGEGRTVAAIDLLWSILSSGTFYAWLELLVASRTDAGLRRSMTAVTERFSQTVERTFGEMEFSVGQLAGRVAAIVRRDLDGHDESLSARRLTCGLTARLP